MKPDHGLAARTLALDLATGEVIRSLGAAGIEAILAKGPAMTHHLYRDAPGRRNYGDIDLLVAPRLFDEACQVLASLGFHDHLAGIRASEAARLQGRPWYRDGAAYVIVDLHRGFHHVADRPAWWELMCRHREVLVVEGQPVMIPDRAGCAVIAALHASNAKPLEEKPLEDLRRALRLFDDEVWRQAAGLAASVGAGGAFAAALCRESAGAELAGRLGLTVTDPVVWFGATSFTRGTRSLSVMLAPGTWADRARRLRDLAFPSKTILVGIRPIAARGRGGVAVAHLSRSCMNAARLPQALLAWYGASRALKRRTVQAPGTLAALPPRRSLQVRAGTAVGTGWWTLRTWWRIHRQLARSQRRNGTLRSPAWPPPPGTARRGTAGPGIAWLEAGEPGRAYPGQAYSGRAARLTLACCRSTCLETALVRQARAFGAGVAVDVVVGVTAPASGFRAHAWLDGDRVDPQFAELWRYPARRTGPDRLRRGA